MEAIEITDKRIMFACISLSLSVSLAAILRQWMRRCISVLFLVMQ